MTSDYRLTVKVRNNRILEAVERTHKSVAAFARDHGIPYQFLNDIICMRKSPIGRNGWYSHIIKLADTLDVEPGELFTDRQITGLPKSTIVRHVDEADIVSLSDSSQPLLMEGDLDETMYNREIASLVDRLQPRKKYIVERFFGLHGQGESTLSEIADDLKVSTGRIHQIMSRAMRDLKKMSAGKGPGS